MSLHRLFAVAALTTLAAPALANPWLGAPILGEMGINQSTSDPFVPAFFQQIATPGTVLPGIDSELIGTAVYVDINDDGTQLIFHHNTSWGSLPFNGLRVEITDATFPPLDGAVYNPTASTYSIDPARITVLGHRAAVNFEGLSGSGTVVLDLPAAGPTLALGTACPSGGPADVAFEGFTPGGTVALLRGTDDGADIIPGGPCAGDVSDLFGLTQQTQQTLQTADGDGNVYLTPNLGAAACGSVVQALDVATCELTDPVVVGAP